MIDFKNVNKLLGGRDILKDADFRINKGERIGFVGPNGAGKTTVFSMICGDMSPDKGEIIKPEKARIGILRQQLGFFKEEQPLIEYVMTASGELPAIQKQLEEIEARLNSGETADEQTLNELGRLQSAFEHLGGYDMEHRAAAALAGLGFPEENFRKPMREFSGGWQMRACMAKVLLGEPDILLLDEPSNYLDIPAVEWLQRKLKTFEGTLLLISHDRYLLNSLTNITLEINGGRVTRYPGNYSYYVKEREGRRLQAEALKKNTEKRKKELQDNINRFRAKATKAAQVQSWIKMLEKIEDVTIPEDLHFQGRIRIPEPPDCGSEIMRLEKITHSYDGTKVILKDVNLSLQKGDKLGIIGYNGMGKSTLLKIIAGRFEASEGLRRPGHKVIIGYQAQEFAELLPAEQTAFDVVKTAAIGGDVPSQRIREILGAFGFSGEAAEKQCKVLSGGEKIRLCFARIFVNPPNLLILDEPTTHLDVSAREMLQEAIRTYKGTICLVSHDMEFLRGTAETILEMTSQKTRLFLGNYDYYKEKTALEQQEEQPKKKETAPGEPVKMNQKEQRREKARRREEMAPEKRRLEREVAKLEKEIEKGEAEKALLIEQLSNPTPDTDFSSLQKQLKALDYDISKATLAWEETATELELFMEEYEKI